VNIDELMKDPVVLGSVGGGLLILVVAGILFLRREKGPKGRVVDDTKARARAQVRHELHVFRDDLKKAVALAGPVFRAIEKETAQKDVVGYCRKSMKHRINIRVPNFNALKGTVRMLGYDAQNLIDLDAGWKKTGKQVADYNSGASDSSKIPITYAKEFEKDLNKMIVLVNMCIGKYGG
jgi:hypothetical protein